VAPLALTGISIGLLRLLLGVWAVHACRRRGSRVDDPALHHLVEQIRLSIGCRRLIEVRELPELATPAAAGCRHPIVLLPPDWRCWNDVERRAVLAHELAHIRRRDYATALLARLAAVLHFYHPLVHWMAARLVLQQELAADAVGAEFAGGRRPYLVALSRLALRQERELSSWPARAFLPARTTLIRRIEMLRNEERMGDRPWSGARRLSAATLLVAVAVVVGSLRGPAWGNGLDAPTGAGKGTTPAKLDQDPIVDLSFLRDNMMGFVAYRPAAAFRRSGMGKCATLINAHLPKLFKRVAEECGRALAQFPLRIEEIELVTHNLSIDRVVQNGEAHQRFMIGGLMVRTAEPFDWKKQFRAWWPDLTEVRTEGHVYYRLPKTPALGPRNGGVYCPDDRTVIVEDEEALIRIIHRKGPPAWVRAIDWEQAGGGLFALALDNRDGRLAPILDKEDPEFFALAPLFQTPHLWVLGLADNDQIDFRARATCNDARAGEATARAAESLLQIARQLVNAPLTLPEREKADRTLVELVRLLKGLVSSFHVTRDGSRVSVRTTGTPQLADLVWLLLEGQANQGQDRSRSSR
jgi:hypothetical protein